MGNYWIGYFMDKLKSVVIGCGAIAREHLIALRELQSVEVAAVCDLSPSRAEATAERFGVAKWYSSHEELLTEIRPDLVHIATPPSSHFQIARNCLDAGLNVLCEKPITVEYSQFSLLKQLALKNNCVLAENQQMRFHSSVQRIHNLLKSGKLGDCLDVQVCVSLNVVAAGSPYIDQNAPHFALALRGGVAGDFLPHIAYLAYMFTGSVLDMRTIWTKHTKDSPLPADEFRGLIKGERATAYVSFSGNSQPDAFLLRVAGTKMRAEANLFEPPRLTLRRVRPGEPALMSMLDGIGEARDVLRGTVAGFWRKLGGKSSYDGLLEFFARTYRALELHEPQPVPLEEVDEVARLVDRFTISDLKL
jgi:predicted dehydrogenase